ncbi:hypothetical protein A3Q56_08403 [Intoshia linei]|uniref:Uncharacterized protein n=1 Tax=Intoshia linei TaxID=1819745 RepID=A0A177AQU5_9BILA|nr:hypothetical protein A3Q56_08403 [Intoshia linei]
MKFDVFLLLFNCWVFIHCDIIENLEKQWDINKLDEDEDMSDYIRDDKERYLGNEDNLKTDQDRIKRHNEFKQHSKEKQESREHQHVYTGTDMLVVTMMEKYTAHELAIIYGEWSMAMQQVHITLKIHNVQKGLILITSPNRKTSNEIIEFLQRQDQCMYLELNSKEKTPCFGAIRQADIADEKKIEL